MGNKNGAQSLEELFQTYLNVLMNDAKLIGTDEMLIEDEASSQSPFPEIANRPPNKAGLYHEFEQKFTLFMRTEDLYKQMTQERQALFSREHQALQEMFDTYAINLSYRLCDGKKN